MLKRFIAVAALAAIFVPAISHAADHSKQWAVGYYNWNAPIGVRYQFSPKAAFDLGLGFDSFKGTDYASSTPATKSYLTYDVEVGIPITLVKTDHADFFFRPGFLWESVPYQLDDGTNPVSDERASNTAIMAHLGAEWHVTDNLSLSVGHGVNIYSSKGTYAGQLTGAKPKSETSFASTALDLTSIGFHWYFTK